MRDIVEQMALAFVSTDILYICTVHAQYSNCPYAQEVRFEIKLRRRLS